MFGVETDKEESVPDLFFIERNIRFTAVDIVKNPFKGRIKKIAPGVHIILMEPIYPNWTYFGWPIMAMGLILSNWDPYWLLPGVALVAAGVFWSRFFYAWMMKMGLRKQGYRGRIRILGHGETLKRVVMIGTNRSI